MNLTSSDRSMSIKIFYTVCIVNNQAWWKYGAVCSSRTHCTISAALYEQVLIVTRTNKLQCVGDIKERNDRYVVGTYYAGYK